MALRREPAAVARNLRHRKRDVDLRSVRDADDLLEDVAKVERPPSMEGRRMSMTIARK